MTQWEYLTAPLLIHNTKQILDNFGADGWELVQIVNGPDGTSLVAYFKRPKSGGARLMSAVEDRLSELGLTVPEVVPPVAAYVPVVREGDLVFTSGQLPMVDGSLAATGKVGAEVDAETAKSLAETCALNAIAAIKSEVGDLDTVSRVVKVVGFVASDPSFTGQPGVINGASELLVKAFGDKGIHARSAVGVSALPLDAPVEVEVVVSVAR